MIKSRICSSALKPFWPLREYLNLPQPCLDRYTSASSPTEPQENTLRTWSEMLTCQLCVTILLNLGRALFLQNESEVLHNQRDMIDRSVLNQSASFDHRWFFPGVACAGDQRWRANSLEAESGLPMTQRYWTAGVAVAPASLPALEHEPWAGDVSMVPTHSH